MTITEKVQILIEDTTPYGTFRDAVYLTPEEYGAATEEDIMAIAEERSAAYVESIENPVTEEITE